MVTWPSGLTSSFQFESYIGYFGLSPKCKEILWILELQRLHQILDHPPLIRREKSQNALFAKVGAICSWMHFGIKLWMCFAESCDTILHQASGIRPDWIEIGPPICSCRNEGIPNNELLVNLVSGGIVGTVSWWLMLSAQALWSSVLSTRPGLGFPFSVWLSTRFRHHATTNWD
jgi:hypothetical protein